MKLLCFFFMSFYVLIKYRCLLHPGDTEENYHSFSFIRLKISLLCVLPSVLHDRVVVVGGAKVPCLDDIEIVLLACRGSSY